MPKIEHIRTFDELDSIKDIWTALEAENSGCSIFQSWIWNRTWCDHYLSSGDKGNISVRLVVGDSGIPLAILPFYDTSPAGPLMKLTQFLGHRMSYSNDIILADPGDPDLAGLVAESLLNDLGCNAVMHLRHLDEGSLFTKQLLLRKLAEPQCSRLTIKADPAVTTQSMRLGKSRLKTFKKAQNHLRNKFNSEYRIKSGSEFQEAFDELIELHNLRFQTAGRSSGFQGKNISFRRDVFEQLNSPDNFEIIQLHADGRTIAAVFMIHDKEVYFSIQSGFDPEFARYSPMRQLLTEAMRHGFDDLNCRQFDFGPGYEQYKYDWAPSVGTNYFCSIGGPGLYAKSLAALYRLAFKRNLPPAQKGSSRVGYTTNK